MICCSHSLTNAIQVTHESSFNVCSKRCDEMSFMKIDPNLSPIHTLLFTSLTYSLLISNFLLIEKKKFIKQIVETFEKVFVNFYTNY